MRKLLPTLQRKLSILGALRSPIFAAIREAYGEANLSTLALGKSPAKGRARPGVRSVLAGEAQETAAETKVRLLGLMVSTVRETYMQEIHPSRCGKPQPGITGSASETLPQSYSNENEEHSALTGLGTAPDQCVPRTVVRIMAMHESAYGPESKSMIELIKALQEKDAFVRLRRAGGPMDSRTAKAGEWSFDTQGLLRCDGKLYVPKEGSAREELLMRNHDDPLAGHFGIDRTQDLISRKYFWRSMPKDIKEYIDSCDICQRTKAGGVATQFFFYSSHREFSLPGNGYRALLFFVFSPPCVCWEGAYVPPPSTRSLWR